MNITVHIITDVKSHDYFTIAWLFTYPSFTHRVLPGSVKELKIELRKSGNFEAAV